jgi:hypothetical protein
MTLRWSRRHTLVAGLALILVTNAVVLAGAAYNRSGEPAAVLQLTERELRAPDSSGFESENSGFALGLAWRVTGRTEDDHGFGGYGGRAAWLDRSKLGELGFDVSLSVGHSHAKRHYGRQLPREVLLVMEMNGPAYQSALQRAEERTARPGATGYDGARLTSERERFSRLFIVDAGLDHDSLRARYPDKSRYAIVRGKVRVDPWYARNTSGLQGSVGALGVSALNVPIELRDVLGRGATGYTANVAFGRRLEPWFTTARKSEPDPATK